MSSKDNREAKVLAALRRGECEQAVARRYRVSPHIVVWLKRQVNRELAMQDA